jgi:nitrogen-specific signal transduction histidine kinase
MKQVFKEEISNWEEVKNLSTGFLTDEELELKKEYDESLSDLKTDMKISVEQFIMGAVTNAYELEVVDYETAPVKKEVIMVTDEEGKDLAKSYVWEYEENGHLVYEVEIEGKN